MTALSDLIAQLNIIDDEADEYLLMRKIAAAEASVSSDIGAETPITYGDAPADLREAILMKAAHLFENREAVLVGISAQELPMGYADLIAPHRKWVF